MIDGKSDGFSLSLLRTLSFVVTGQWANLTVISAELIAASKIPIQTFAPIPTSSPSGSPNSNPSMSPSVYSMPYSPSVSPSSNPTMSPSVYSMSYSSSVSPSSNPTMSPSVYSMSYSSNFPTTAAGTQLPTETASTALRRHLQASDATTSYAIQNGTIFLGVIASVTISNPSRFSYT